VCTATRLSLASTSYARATGAFAVLALVGIGAAVPGNALAACANEGLRWGPSLDLPDCRAYEQVSPVEKGGFDAVSRVSSLQYPTESDSAGEAVSYIGNGAFSGAVGSLLPNAHISSRGASGWLTTDLTPPTLRPTTTGGTPIGYDFSEDLSQMVTKVAAEPLTAGMPSGTERLYNLFLRHPDGAYALVNALPPTVFPPSTCEGCIQIQDVLSFAGASSDFTHILFEADDILEGTGATSGFPTGNLYESSGGAVHLVGILPDGIAATGGATPGAGGAYFSGVLYSSVAREAWLRVRHAISKDGSRVVFRALSDGGPPDAAQNGMPEVYDRIEGNRTIEISAPAPGASPAHPAAGPAQFWAASTDGSVVLFTSSAELTTSANTGPTNSGQDLYRYNVDAEETVDLTVDNNPADAEAGAGVLGVVGASDDGSNVYFVATGELIKGKGVDGQPNLYVTHEDPASHVREVRFIATLAPGDLNDWTATPSELQAYVTPDGQHMALMSLNSLTGYDNSDQANGASPDSEVYEYGIDSGVLTCASCDPSGRRPSSNAFLGATMLHLASTPFHQPRVMSDDGGRLFFSSRDSLVPGAERSHVKIYEHAREGVGSCVQAGGCVFLISSRVNSTDDVFLDASGDGSDVFFSTLSQLAASDGDNLVDVYDAREGGGFAVPVASAQCASDCQTPLDGSSAQAPLASGFNGPSGNIAQPARPRVTNAQKLAKALRACSKKPLKKRAVCRSRARRRYGVKAAAIRTAHRSSHRGRR
jgi:hypothetical protein